MLADPAPSRPHYAATVQKSVPESVFPAVEPASAVYPQLLELRAIVAHDPVLRDAPEVRAELLPRRRADGSVVLRRFYWSARRADGRLPLGFAARTLHVHEKAPEPRTYDFPEEPVMQWLAEPSGPLRAHGGSARIEVLRYIPLRRVTFRLHGAAGLPTPVIAKTKRETSLRRAARILVATQRAVARAGIQSFVVPRPVGLDIDRRLLYLDQLPGDPLSEVLDELADGPALSRLGLVQRELHELAVTGAGIRSCADWLAAARVAADQIALLAPSATAQLRLLETELVAGCPVDDELAFCQGDFVPSQILCGPERWAVLDLDDGHYSDPHAEVAALYAALPRELSVSEGARAESLRAAYLDGYLRRAGRDLDPVRWRWFLTVATLRYLARRLVKGRAQPGEVAEVLATLPATAPA